jgi:hypothetical protein
MRFCDKISHVRAKAIKICVKVVTAETLKLEPFEFY